MTGKGLWYLASIGFLLGVLHLALTLPIYGALSLEALWFGASGLAMSIFAAECFFTSQHPR